MKFVERRQFSGDPGEVWARVRDVDSIPKYWHGTRELKVTSRGERTLADVVFGFGGKGKEEISVDEAGRTLTIRFLEGPFRGTQRVTVKGDSVEAEWDVAFRGAFKVISPWNASHFRSGTRHALERLSQQA
jgi:Polyketide cyclase / dehydrase and lipid transport